MRKLGELKVFKLSENSTKNLLTHFLDEVEYNNFVLKLGEKYIKIQAPTKILCEMDYESVKNKTTDLLNKHNEIFWDFTYVDDIDEVIVPKLMKLIKEFPVRIIINYAINQSVYYRLLDRGLFYYLKDKDLYIFCRKDLKKKMGYDLPRMDQIISHKIMPIIEISSKILYEELFESFPNNNVQPPIIKDRKSLPLSESLIERISEKLKSDGCMYIDDVLTEIYEEIKKKKGRSKEDREILEFLNRLSELSLYEYFEHVSKILEQLEDMRDIPKSIIRQFKYAIIGLKKELYLEKDMDLSKVQMETMFLFIKAIFHFGQYFST